MLRICCRSRTDQRHLTPRYTFYSEPPSVVSRLLLPWRISTLPWTWNRSSVSPWSLLKIRPLYGSKFHISFTLRICFDSSLSVTPTPLVVWILVRSSFTTTRCLQGCGVNYTKVFVRTEKKPLTENPMTLNRNRVIMSVDLHRPSNVVNNLQPSPSHFRVEGTELNPTTYKVWRGSPSPSLDGRRPENGLLCRNKPRKRKDRTKEMREWPKRIFVKEFI